MDSALSKVLEAKAFLSHCNAETEKWKEGRKWLRGTDKKYAGVERVAFKEASLRKQGNRKGLTNQDQLLKINSPRQYLSELSCSPSAQVLPPIHTHLTALHEHFVCVGEHMVVLFVCFFLTCVKF